MKKTLNIEGMSCGHCVNHVKTALSAIDGITKVDVSLENKRAVIDLVNDINDDTLSEAIQEVGYEVKSVV